MNKQRNQRVIVGSILLCLIGGALFLVWYARPDNSTPTNSTYYSGVRRIKGDPYHVVDEKGTITPLPSGIKPIVGGNAPSLKSKVGGSEK